jgi:hypothetical protein
MSQAGKVRARAVPSEASAGARLFARFARRS